MRKTKESYSHATLNEAKLACNKQRYKNSRIESCEPDTAKPVYVWDEKGNHQLSTEARTPEGFPVSAKSKHCRISMSHSSQII